MIAAAAGKIPLSEWAQLKGELLWIYDAPIDPAFCKETNPGLGQSALLVRQGKVLVRTRKGTVQAGPGQWIFPREGPRYQELTPDTHVLSVHFNLSWPGKQPLFEWDVATVIDAAKTPQLEIRAKRLERFVEREFPRVRVDLSQSSGGILTNLMLRHYFSAWLYIYVKTLVDLGFTPSRLGKMDSKVLQVVRLIESMSLQEPFREEILAQKLSVGARQLDRLFFKQFGMTPRRYYEQRRLEHAVTRVRSRGLFKEIAYELGFGTLSHFSNWFRSKTGVSPREYFRTRKNTDLYDPPKQKNISEAKRERRIS